MAYKWTFEKVGGRTRVYLQTAEDIRHLAELDQKMWTVLSCPVNGLEIPAESLSLMDSDGDGQLRINEVIAASQWLCANLKDPAVLFERKDTLPIDALVDEDMLKVAKALAGKENLISLGQVQAAMDAVTIEPAKVPEAPFEADVMAAYREKKAEYAAYFEQLKLAKLGLAPMPAEEAVVPMKEKDFLDMSAKVDAYDAAVAAAAKADADALAAGQAQYLPLRKLLTLSRDFVTLLHNYVTFDDFYHKEQNNLAVFQAGTLIIDQRACTLCIEVNDMSKHDAQAGASGMYLMYLDCTSRTLGKTKKIAVAMTVGEINSLYVGKNAVFYDRQGRDWDATIVKIIDNPISIKQAFWSPYRKFAKWVTDMVNKSAAEKDNKAFEDMTSKAQEVTANPEAAKEASKKQAFDIAKFAGIFAAIGMAVGFIGEFMVGLVSGINATPWWKLLIWIVAIMLVISGPSMIMAWIKLRRRNLAPLLNANGWAINSDAIINVPFGATLTEEVKFPLIKMKDPFAEKRMAWWKVLLIILAFLVGLAAALWLCNLCAPYGYPSPLPYFAA